MARNPGGAEEFPQLPPLPTSAFPEDVKKTVAAFNANTEEYYQKLNGRISIGTPESLAERTSAWSGHLDGELIKVTVPAQNADFAIAHNLERVPLGFLPLDGTSASPLHRLATTPAHTSQFLWVRTAAAVGSRFLILVL